MYFQDSAIGKFLCIKPRYPGDSFRYTTNTCSLYYTLLTECCIFFFNLKTCSKEESIVCYAVFTLYVVFYRTWLIGKSFFYYTLFTIYVVFCMICTIREFHVLFSLFTFYVVFYRTCLMFESPFITLFNLYVVFHRSGHVQQINFHV